jgi:hypothetical protein
LIRHSRLFDAAGMAPIDRKLQVQRRMLRLLDDNGLPAPDEVELGEREVRFLWLDRKVALVVELDTDEYDDHIPEGIAC